jgi:hypothetical protein
MMGPQMIVMDEDSCMVDVARYFIHFLTEKAAANRPLPEELVVMLNPRKIEN